MSPTERAKRRAGKQLGIFLDFVSVAEDHQVRADFLTVTLRQRQEYQVLLLDHCGLDDLYVAVKALTWDKPKTVVTFAGVYRTIASRTETMLAGSQDLAATALYVDSSLSLKHALLTDVEAWNKYHTTLEAKREVVREAASSVIALIEILCTARLVTRDDANRRIQRAFSEQQTWILSGFGSVPP